MNVAIMLSLLNRNSSDKTTCCQCACQSLYSWAHCCHRRRWLGILHKESFACSPWCSIHRRIDKENSEAPAKLDKCAVNCLDKAAQTISIMRMICISLHVNVTFRVPLSGFLVVWSLLKFSLLPYCYATHMLLLHEGEILLPEDRWFSTIQIRQLLKCHYLPLKRHSYASPRDEISAFLHNSIFLEKLYFC